jgi:hypothetical protein
VTEGRRQAPALPRRGDLTLTDLSSDATMTFYGEGGRSSVPVNLGFGNAFSPHFVGAVRGFYTVAGAGRGDVQIEFLLDFQP